MNAIRSQTHEDQNIRGNLQGDDHQAEHQTQHQQVEEQEQVLGEEDVATVVS